MTIAVDLARKATKTNKQKLPYPVPLLFIQCVDQNVSGVITVSIVSSASVITVSSVTHITISIFLDIAVSLPFSLL